MLTLEQRFNELEAQILNYKRSIFILSQRPIDNARLIDVAQRRMNVLIGQLQDVCVQEGQEWEIL
jgi:hypothetical protein